MPAGISCPKLFHLCFRRERAVGFWSQLKLSGYFLPDRPREFVERRA